MKRGRQYYEMTIGSTSWESPRMLFAGPSRDFHLGWESLTKRYGGPLPVCWIDLLRIATSIYVADLSVMRQRKGGVNAWRRRINLTVPVFDYELWGSEEISLLLRKLVSFVSGDSWDVRLSPAPFPDTASHLHQKVLHESFSHHGEISCLYSGGLDSAAGLSKRLLNDPEACFAPVTVGHRSALQSEVDLQIDLLRRRFGSRLSAIHVPFEFHRRGLCPKREPSQRTRSLLFMAVGGVVAAMNGTDRLEAYESGIGAINAPLMGSMRGSHATRGMHPLTLQLMSDLLSCVFESSFQVILPFINLTKADLVRTTSGSYMRQLAPITVSCAHYPIRHVAGAGHRQCGVCPACIFRRVALVSAGVEEPGKNYEYDLLDPNCTIPAKKRLALIAFLNQIDAIAAASDSQLPAPIAAHLKASGVVSEADQLPQFARFYRRYAKDWGPFIRQGRRNGCDWTKLIDARSAAA